MHPQLTADYSAARAAELRRCTTTEVPTHWRVRRKRHHLWRRWRDAAVLRPASQVCEGSAP